jgi:Peptidase propeptide and YPEB domain
MRTTIFATAAAAVIALSGTSFAKAPAPKITEAAARKTAMTLVKGGVVKSSELETEHSQLIYSFDIATPGKSGIDEVNISAMTGKLVAKTHEGPAKEAAEAAADAKAAKMAKPR